MSPCTSQPNYKHAQFKRSYQNNARENPHIMNVAESDINYQPGIQARVTKKKCERPDHVHVYNNHTKSELCWIRTWSEDTTLTDIFAITMTLKTGQGH